MQALRGDGAFPARFSGPGRLRPESDIDLLVTFETEASVTLFTLVDLQEELSRLLDRPVDLVPKGGLKPELKSEVLAEARILYAA